MTNNERGTAAHVEAQAAIDATQGCSVSPDGREHSWPGTIKCGEICASSFTLNGSNNKPMVTINSDATIKLGESVELDKAAREFWFAVRQAGLQLSMHAHALTDKQIKCMVDRFLGWKLPRNFSPDAGISYTPPNYHPDMNPENVRPSGTNLFDAAQATEMVRYLTAGMSTVAAQPEANSPVYLKAERAAVSLSHDELIMLYNTMDGAAIIEGKQPGDYGNLILEAFARRVIKAAVIRETDDGEAFRAAQVIE